jgi:hypothetical protein
MKKRLWYIEFFDLNVKRDTFEDSTYTLCAHTRFQGVVLSLLRTGKKVWNYDSQREFEIAFEKFRYLSNIYKFEFYKLTNRIIIPSLLISESEDEINRIFKFIVDMSIHNYSYLPISLSKINLYKLNTSLLLSTLR